MLRIMFLILIFLKTILLNASEEDVKKTDNLVFKSFHKKNLGKPNFSPKKDAIDTTLVEVRTIKTPKNKGKIISIKLNTFVIKTTRLKHKLQFHELFQPVFYPLSNNFWDKNQLKKSR